jgi:hypothetical protein
MTDGGSNELDDRLARLVHDALGALDAPPADLVAAAKDSFTWRTIDAELAELTFDSSTDDALAGVRGTATARSLSFEVRDVVIDIEVTEAGDRRDLLGQVSPEGTRSLLLDRGGQQQPIELDALGRFRVEAANTGPVRFVVQRADGTVTTDWIIL